ncbi:MAG: hypothetical protein WCT20_05480 [Candidatus Babeliales bacterium]
MYNIRKLLSLSLVLMTMIGASLLADADKATSTVVTNDGQSLLSPDQIEKLVDKAFDSEEKKVADTADTIKKPVLTEAKKALNAQLRKFKITGAATYSPFDFEWACIYKNKHPRFCVFFNDDEGNVKVQKFQANIRSLGGQVGIALLNSTIFITNSDVNYLHAMDEIQLGTGIDITLCWLIGLSFTYVPFLNAPGGMIIIGTGFGFEACLSIVFGGSLTPVKNTSDEEADGDNDNDDDDND